MIARFTRNIVVSSTLPTLVPSRRHCAVVSLSIMRRLVPASPTDSFASISRRISGASVGSVVNGHTVTESVSKRSFCTIRAERRPPI